jgi:hypothetical protein
MPTHTTVLLRQHFLASDNTTKQKQNKAAKYMWKITGMHDLNSKVLSQLNHMSRLEWKKQGCQCNWIDHKPGKGNLVYLF